MAIQMNDLGQGSNLARDLAWLELALDTNNERECCHLIYVDEMNGKRLMLATDRFRFHIATQFSMCFPLGYIANGEDTYEPDGDYGPYQRILRTVTGAKITLNRALLEQTLTKCLRLLPKNNEHKKVICAFTPNKGTLSVYSQIKGIQKFELPCSANERPETMRVNAQFLLDAITGSESPNVMIQQNRDKDGCILVTMNDGRAAIIKLLEPVFSIR